VVEELLLVGDHPVQELEGEEMDADVGSRVDQRPVLHRQLGIEPVQPYTIFYKITDNLNTCVQYVL
jgi:hypothetical protein